MNCKLILLTILLSACSQLSASKATDSQCTLKPEAGRCRANISKYYFDEKSASCAQFSWGGCGGVVPFTSLEECQNMCGETINSELQEKLAHSFSIWQQQKIKQGDSYQYSSKFVSWVGVGSETTITVNDGIIISRKYHAWDADKKETAQWAETNSKELGKNKEGAALKTIDELYAQCRTILATKDAESNHLYLGFDENGIIEHCLFTPKQCADDCSSGVRIKNLHFL
ncbi:MAG: hypothetical protein GQ581_05470 [Methyloprofundus sp.]|nr:hypothetical protein [Methyloprofundus sp.]